VASNFDSNKKDMLGLCRVLWSNNVQVRTVHIQIEGVTVRAQIKGVQRQNNMSIEMCDAHQTNRKQGGFPLRDLGKDHALGSDQHPETMMEDEASIELQWQLLAAFNCTTSRASFSFSVNNENWLPVGRLFTMVGPCPLVGGATSFV